ncbi:MAG: TetR/AcrR family transcriptional regulator [Clostridia bacterium]|nr:TetR/AcrR family transcriptional regulator [Clostridia bacterium]
MKINQRVKLTRRLLKEALVDILQETPFNKVTISEICARAEINRTTFYKHYSDEFDLYYDIENDALQLLQNNLSEYKTNAVEVILTALCDNRKLAYILFNSNVDPDLPEKIFSLQVISDMIKKAYNPQPCDYDKLYSFICNGGYAIVKNWINSDFYCSPKEISDFLCTAAYKLLQ